MVQPADDERAERRRLRALRRSIPAARRAAAERAIAARLRRLGCTRRGLRVAAYLAMPGEASLARFIAAATASGVRLCVPRISSRRRRRLEFVELVPGAGRRRGAYGIEEPAAHARRVRLREIDVVLVPLVGFDRDGHRLGMGAGYYDRALSPRRTPGRAYRRPRLLGIAYACQELASIRPQPWDVALDAVVTERELIVPRAAARRR
ncbi:MAG: 5-formyltetrahydrofolate cyclo-ligase [Steroidobacteraceae bacterium]